MNKYVTRENFLLLLAFAVPLAFSSWMALLNNFSIEVASFTGKEIGILQSLREVPGFLAFTAVFALLLIREQRLAILSLFILGFGVAITGYFPTVLGLYVTTVIMSIGFHYMETVNQSLTLQWLPKEKAAEFMGRAMSVKACAAIISFGGIWLLYEWLNLPYKWLYLIFGGAGMAIAVFAFLVFPQFQQQSEQHKRMVVRSRYWLFYLLTFLSGARRQIFVVFAGFLMVEKFGYSVSQIALLYLINHFFNLLFAPSIGRLISRIGERNALTIEYLGLVVVFVGYALVENGYVAAALYVVDHLFFAMAIAIKTYFQKIADERDIASTAGVSFTINHIAAVFLPVVLGLVWLISPASVFYLGAALAFCSLVLSQLIPSQPRIGYGTNWVTNLKQEQQ